MNRLLLYYLLLIVAVIGCKQNEEPVERVNGAYEALNWQGMQRAYPNADIPTGAYLKADAQRVALQQTSSRSNITPWEARGPWNTAGRTLTLAFNPQNDRTLYAGSASGGLWRSYNQGEGVSWERVPLGYPVLGVSSIAFASNDSMTMYIGTGEVYNFDAAGTGAAYRNTRGTYGVGILKSTDGGVTWARVMDTPYQEQMGVWAVRVAQTDPNIVYAATTHGVYKSTNAGSSWIQVLDVVMAMDMVVSPLDPDHVIVGCGNFGTPGRGIYRTADGGSSWEHSEDITEEFNGKIQLSMYQADPDILYASIGNGFGFSDGASWLYRSDDGGSSWSLKNTTDFSLWQGWFAHDVAVSPDNPDVITVLGIDVWQSENGGDSLRQMTFGGTASGTPPIGEPEDTSGRFSHSDHHDVIYHATDPDLVIVANDGGINRSLDGGNTFGTINGGYQTTQFYNGFSVSSLDPEFTLGGLQDNNTVMYSGDEAWNKVFRGDGSWTALHPTNPDIIFASLQGLNMGVSLDGGNIWASFAPPNNGDATAFIAPFVLAPSDPQTIYAGRSTVYKTEDLGVIWNPAQGMGINQNPAFSMAISPYDSDVCYAGFAPLVSPASVWVTTNGVSWREVTNGLPDRFPTDLTVDPTDHSRAYCVFSGFGTGHLFMTEDFGETWTDISTELPDVPGQSVIVDPAMSEHIYYGDDFGIYFSPDRGASWESFSEGLPEAVIAMDLKISSLDRKLWVATHGNGAYRTDLVPLTTSNQIAYALVSAAVFPNPFQSKTRLSIQLTESTTTSVSVYDVQGTLVTTLMDVRQLSPGHHEVEVLGETWPAGMYMVHIETEGRKGVLQAVKSR